MTPSKSSESALLRVDPATVVIFSALFSPALLVGVMKLWDGGPIWDGLALCASYFGVVYWICSPVVELAPGHLEYRNLFARRSIDLSYVESVAVVSRPAPTLALRCKARERAPFAFIIKPFSKVGVATILRHIRAECPNARFDLVSDDLCRGDFHSVTRQTINVGKLMFLFAVGSILMGGLVKYLLRWFWATR